MEVEPRLRALFKRLQNGEARLRNVEERLTKVEGEVEDKQLQLNEVSTVADMISKSKSKWTSECK